VRGHHINTIFGSLLVDVLGFSLTIKWQSRCPISNEVKTNRVVAHFSGEHTRSLYFVFVFTYGTWKRP
jgi:hypothetical protein